MKIRLAAPAVGLMLALLTAGCGGGSSSDASPTPAPAPGPTAPGPAPAPATTANSVAQVKADMTGAHATVPAGVTTGGPGVTQGTAPAGSVALGGFGQVYLSAASTAANTRVQLRNFETYVLVRSTGQWKRVQFSERVNGAFYSANYGAAGAGSATVARNESSGGVSVKPASGQVFRFWPESGLTQTIVPVNDVDAVFTTVQARLVVDSAAGADDRASARMLVSTAADWRNSMTLYASAVPAPSDILAGTPMGTGKLILAGENWRAMNFHSATASQADALANAGPGAGAKAPIANSTPVDVARARRVIVIGDSISEGGFGHYSYRRPLWNGIVSDASNPLVDFVGTREGISPTGGNCSNSVSTSGATPVVPEFDSDHQAYWGWCADGVNGELQVRLPMLAGSAVDRLPDAALVHLGTNDINQQNQIGGQIRTDLDALISTLRSANPAIRIVLAQVIPMSSGTPAKDAQVPVLNSEIASLAFARSTGASPVTVVDQFTGFDSTDRYDGFHPDDSGERKIADKWLPALKSALQ
ncbi:MAG: GDSL-type esterase/lipase family protein [Lautropia sp.]